MTLFIIAYHVSLVNVQTNYFHNNLLILDVKQLNKTMRFYYFYNLKALCNGQGKIKMYYGMFRVKKQLSGKRSIVKLVVIVLHFKGCVCYILQVCFVCLKERTCEKGKMFFISLRKLFSFLR